MKKTICFLAFFALLCLFLYAAEDDGSNNQKSQEKERFNLSAGFTFTSSPKLYGGHFEFGFEIYSGVIYIQNRFLLRAGGFKTDDIDNTVLTLSEKLVFGHKLTNGNSGTYLYIEGGIGTYGNVNRGFFDDSLAYSFGLGGGFYFGDYEFGGIYLEAGYLGQKTAVNFPISGVLVQTGWRIFI